MSRSGLKSVARITTPPRGVRMPASGFTSETSVVRLDEKLMLGPVAVASSTSTSMPSRLSA